MNEILKKVIDEVYTQYKTDNSLRSAAYIHPMFYNRTFSKNNEYIPEEPETLLTKEEFIEKMNSDVDSKWHIGIQVLYIYLSKQNE